MPSLHRCRVAMVGTKADMLRLNRVLLENIDRYEEAEEGPGYTLEDLYRQVHENAAWEEGDTCSFLYGMIARGAFGGAVSGTGRYEMACVAEDLYAAVFTYDSMDNFQQEDWLRLHNACARTPMFVIHADEEFALDKGYLAISNNCVQETWDMMAESWMWLMEQYEAGLTPEEIPVRLEHLQAMMRREDWDQSIDEVLAACEENMTMLAQAEPVTADAIREKREARDFPALFELQAMLADTYLWDVARSARHLACIRMTREVWQAYSAQA